MVRASQRCCRVRPNWISIRCSAASKLSGEREVSNDTAPLRYGGCCAGPPTADVSRQELLPLMRTCESTSKQATARSSNCLRSPRLEPKPIRQEENIGGAFRAATFRRRQSILRLPPPKTAAIFLTQTNLSMSILAKKCKSRKVYQILFVNRPTTFDSWWFVHAINRGVLILE